MNYCTGKPDTDLVLWLSWGCIPALNSSSYESKDWSLQLGVCPFMCLILVTNESWVLLSLLDSTDGLNVTVMHPLQEVTLRNLEPFEEYAVWMKAVSVQGLSGPLSSMALARTKESGRRTSSALKYSYLVCMHLELWFSGSQHQVLHLWMWLFCQFRVKEFLCPGGIALTLMASSHHTS